MSFILMYLAIAASGLSATLVTAKLIGESRNIFRTLLSALAGFAAGFVVLFCCNLVYPSVSTIGIVEIALIGTAAGIAVGRKSWVQERASDDLRGG